MFLYIYVYIYIYIYTERIWYAYAVRVSWIRSAPGDSFRRPNGQPLSFLDWKYCALVVLVRSGKHQLFSLCSAALTFAECEAQQLTAYKEQFLAQLWKEVIITGMHWGYSLCSIHPEFGRGWSSCHWSARWCWSWDRKLGCNNCNVIVCICRTLWCWVICFRAWPCGDIVQDGKTLQPLRWTMHTSALYVIWESLAQIRVLEDRRTIDILLAEVRNSHCMLASILFLHKRASEQLPMEGKYLIIPPGYDGQVPDGYFVFHSPTFTNFVVNRGRSLARSRCLSVGMPSWKLISWFLFLHSLKLGRVGRFFKLDLNFVLARSY